MKFSAPTQRRLGSLLVAMQVSLIAFLGLLAIPAVFGGRAPWGAWVMAGASGLLGLWALISNRPGNFNIRPTPRVGGRLIQAGPYRWIRHPMYTAVMAFGLACAWSGDSTSLLWGWLGAVALGAVLATKAMLEERWMLSVHAEYAAYRTRSWRFLPGLF